MNKSKVIARKRLAVHAELDCLRKALERSRSEAQVWAETAQTFSDQINKAKRKLLALDKEEKDAD